MVSALIEDFTIYGFDRIKVLVSSDPRCEMEIQRIEELHHDTTTLNDKMDGNPPKPNLSTDGSITHPDFEDAFPADLVSMSDTEEGPEVFKRVRFLSRWEFRLESRGPLEYKTGQYNWWAADCPEAQVMKDALGATLWDHVCEIEELNSVEQYFALNLFFVGSTLQQSRPVLLIFSMTKQGRREAWRHSTGIDWIKANPSLVVLTSCSTIFHSTIKQIYDERFGVLKLEDS
jgi:hypothetical protein